VGFDVSPVVSRQAVREAQSVKRRIDRARPDLAAWVQRGWSELPRELALGPFGCLQMVPTSVSQRRPELDDNEISTVVTVSGKLQLDRQCGASHETGEAPPSLMTSDDAPETHLALPLPYGWPEVGLALTRALTARPGEPRISEVTARGAKVNGESRVALRLQSPGACGPVWLTAEPWHDPRTDQIRFRGVTALPGRAGELGPATLKSLIQRVERDAVMTLPLTTTDAKRAIDGLLQHLDSEQPDAKLRSVLGQISVSAALDITDTSVLVGPETLVPVIGLRGRVDVRPK
jgi:hypothetical protein